MTYIRLMQIPLTSVRTFDINERKTNFEIANILKAITLPSSLRRRIRQTLKTF